MITTFKKINRDDWMANGMGLTLETKVSNLIANFFG